MWAVAPVIVITRYGVKHFGFNWGTISFAEAVGQLALQPIAGAVYSTFNSDGKQHRRLQDAHN